METSQATESTLVGEFEAASVFYVFQACIERFQESAFFVVHSGGIVLPLLGNIDLYPCRIQVSFFQKLIYLLIGREMLLQLAKVRG